MRAFAATLFAFPCLIALSSCHSSGGTSSTSGAGGQALGPPGQLSVWTTGVGRKVQPTTAVGTSTTVTVDTCSDATVSFQVVVHGKNGSLTQVEVAVQGDLSDGNGHTLSKDGVTFYRAYFIDMSGVSANFGNVPVPKDSPTSDPMIPDPLIPLVDPYTGANAGQPFDVVQEQNQPVFADVHVPKGTAAGTYTGTIQVTSAEGQAEVPLSVTVWGLDLPDMTTVTTHFKMSINDLYDYHAGTAECSGSSCYLATNQQALTVVHRYEELAHDHRIDTGEQLINLPGTGGCDVPSASDWMSYDNAMTPYMNGSYWADGIPSGRLDTPFNPGQNYGPDGTCTQAQYVALAAAWSSHLKSQGWFDKAVVYAYDEPPASAYPAIAKDSAWLQQADPDWKARVMDTVSPQPSSAAILNPALGIYTVTTPWYDDWSDFGPYYGRAQWPALFAMGIQLWFDEGNAVNPPYATFASNTLDGLEPVILMWGSWYEQATGFLYWDIASWDDTDPWGPEITWGKTGDGVMLYPGNHDGQISPIGSPADVAIDGPVPSYRLKMLRQGLEDWALFHLADTLGLGTMARQQVSQVYSQLGGCTYPGCPAPAGGFFWKTDEATMATIRSTIVQAIIQKQGS